MARYALSDLHGMKAIWDQISNFLGPNDLVYFLGDAGDRGPDSWELIKALASDPRVKYLKGNHEEMLKNAIYEHFDESCWFSEAINLLAYNGGYETFEGWLNDGAHLSWAKFLATLPTHIEIENKQGHKLFLSHAGFTPGRYPNETEIPCEKDLLWDRHHFRHFWPSDPMYANAIVIHGHTPILCMPEHKNCCLTNDEEIEPGAFWYCNNHKINIDTGAYYTGTAVLLDLDTFDEHIFILDEED